jgi:SAM-dependent methyltransferase
VSAEVLGASFRDPHGFVFTIEGRPYRQVSQAAASDYDHLRSSGLYDELTERGLLVAHEEADLALAPAPGAYRVLAPEVVPFVSYPYEWCFSQLRAAALATLEIQRLATARGMSLRDASAYNIQFPRGSAQLIDTLSFEVLREGSPWVAYRQFCQHFLAPLALAALVDVDLLRLSRVHLDGVPLALASRLLPARTRLRPGLALHLHQHARSQGRHDAAGGGGTGKVRTVSRRALEGLVDNLTGVVRGLSWHPGRSTWSHYYEGDSYTDAAFEDKQAAVAGMLAEVKPGTVFDLGANTGAFSRLAVEAGAYTVSFDLDPAAVERNWKQVTEERAARLLPLVQDLTDPSPALGWAHTERSSLAERGPADLALALALVHHLAIAGNVPLERVAAYLRRLASRLVVEFVPKPDPKVQLLLRGREDVFPGYTQAGFEEAFRRHFEIERRHAITGSERTLYLMTGR